MNVVRLRLILYEHIRFYFRGLKFCLFPKTILYSKYSTNSSPIRKKKKRKGLFPENKFNWMDMMLNAIRNSSNNLMLVNENTEYQLKVIDFRIRVPVIGDGDRSYLLLIYIFITYNFRTINIYNIRLYINND